MPGQAHAHARVAKGLDNHIHKRRAGSRQGPSPRRAISPPPPRPCPPPPEVYPPVRRPLEWPVRPGNIRRPLRLSGRECWASPAPAALFRPPSLPVAPVARPRRSRPPAAAAGILPANGPATAAIYCGLTARNSTSDLSATATLSSHAWPARGLSEFCPRGFAGSAASRFAPFVSPARTNPCPSAVAIFPAPINPIRCFNITQPPIRKGLYVNLSHNN